MKNINNALIDDFIGRAIRRLSLERPAARYLEVGCGDLRYSRYINEDDWDCIFSDYEPRSERVTVIADAHSLPFEDSSFDVVMITEVVEHLHTPEKAIEELSRVIRPGGDLVMTMPFMYQMHEMPNDYSRWTEFMISDVFSRRGFKITTFERRGDAFGVVLTIFSNLANGFVDSLSRKRSAIYLAYPARLIIDATLGLAVGLYVRSRLRRRRSYTHAGEGLAGVDGHLQLWHLGYNVIFRKREA